MAQRPLPAAHLKFLTDSPSMEEENFRKNPESQTALYKYAASLYAAKNSKEIEKLFAKYLRSSYDLDFWNLYIEYVKKISVKKVSLGDVYAFVLNHFEFAYERLTLTRDCIVEFSNLEDDTLKAEKIRKVYHRAFTAPMHGLGLLWNEYEKWEVATNKAAARGFIEQVQPTYNNTCTVYQRLAPYVQNDDYFRILDIELENPLKMPRKSHDARLLFLFNFYIAKFPSTEALLFLRSFYLKDAVQVERPETLFLSVWYSFLYGTNYFNFDDKKNFDLVSINYFNWIVKNEGIEQFRLKFQEVKTSVGPHAYIYAAHVEFYQGGSKETAYQTLMEASARFSDSSLVCEQFLSLFMRIGDDDNVRPLFKKLGKTARMWDMMIEYEFQHGDIEQYRGLIVQRQEALRRQEDMPSVPQLLTAVPSEGCRGVYEGVLRNFGFLDLQFSVNDLCAEFLAKLPKLGVRDNIFLNVDTAEIVELLATL